MAGRENIRVADPNFTTDGEYFYSLSDTAQILQVKTDDGSVAFSYPCDTQLGDTVTSLSWDGVHFWSQETKAGGGGLILRKWAIESYIFKQKNAFTLSDDATHTYSSNDMGVEYYELTVGDNDNGGGGYTKNLSEINISSTTGLSPGDVLTFVRRATPTHNRSSTSFVETATVQSVVDSNTVKLTGLLTGDPYGDGKGFRGPSATYNSSTEPVPPDLVYVTKNIWVLNDNAPSNTATAAIYRINPSNGNVLVAYSGSQFLNIKGAAFYGEYSTAGVFPWVYNTALTGKYLLFVNSSSLLFFNVDTATVTKSLNLGNIKANGIDVWDVFDVAIGGHGSTVSLYRLQDGTSYGDPISDESWSTAYSYEKTLLARVVNSISVVAEPTIVPADGSSTSSITAIVRDQYNNAVQGKLVTFSDDAGGRLTPTNGTTDVFGRVHTTYVAGVTELDVKITATVENGLVT